jgi:hypothetical protein
MSRTVKIQIYGTLVGPAVVFGSATGLRLRWICKDWVQRKVKY